VWSKPRAPFSQRFQKHVSVLFCPGRSWKGNGTPSCGPVMFWTGMLSASNSISVTFDQEEIFTGTNLALGATIDLQLYQPAEPTLDLYITFLIILLVILIVVIAMYALRKQKSAKIRVIAGGSEELLTTKKALLMSLLKEVEKQHRANQISDDTYHKLKERYKQEAVEAMKQLEDMKSKVK